jgi:FAD:protein FMN transferase
MMLSRRHAVLGLAAAGPLAFLSRDLVVVSRPATAFGTTVRITVSAETATIANAAIDAGYAEIRAIEKAFNIFDPQSEVSQLNATGYLVNPSSLMQEVMQLSQTLWVATSGAFDPAVQPLWLAWQNGRPDQALITDAVRHADWRNVLLNQHKISFTRNGMALTFNGVAQGHAADRVITAVKAKGAIAAAVDTGEIGITEESNLAIRDPRDPHKMVATLSLASGFIATSGDYATTFTPDFENHHIFDPATGHSPRELASATVIAPTGAQADGLATAFMVMGSARALAYTHQNPEIKTLLISKSGKIFASKNLGYHT